MSLFDLHGNEDWDKVPKNDVQRQLERLREQYRSDLRNCSPAKTLETLRLQIKQYEALLES